MTHQKRDGLVICASLVIVEVSPLKKKGFNQFGLISLRFELANDDILLEDLQVSLDNAMFAFPDFQDIRPREGSWKSRSREVLQSLQPLVNLLPWPRCC